MEKFEENIKPKTNIKKPISKEKKMELTEQERLDVEAYNKFFEDKTHYPVDDPDYWEKRKADPEAKKYVAKEGIVPALVHEIWDHDTDLKSIENVIEYCYENKLYGKTLEEAVKLITSKKAVKTPEEHDAESVIGIMHIIGHFHEKMYETGRMDLARKLNEYVVKTIIDFEDASAYVKGLGSGYPNPIGKIIAKTGKNPLPFKDSGYDNEKLLDLIKGKYYYEIFIQIKHFDETGELLPQEEIKEPEETTKGVYVDVDGTLVVGENQLNQRIVDKLKEYKDLGKNIVIFTGGDTGSQKERLVKLGLEKEIGEFKVVSKGSFQNKKLEITIDDFSQDQLKNIFGIFSENHIQS